MNSSPLSHNTCVGNERRFRVPLLWISVCKWAESLWNAPAPSLCPPLGKNSRTENSWEEKSSHESSLLISFCLTCSVTDQKWAYTLAPTRIYLFLQTPTAFRPIVLRGGMEKLKKLRVRRQKNFAINDAGRSEAGGHKQQKWDARWRQQN